MIFQKNKNKNKLKKKVENLVKSKMINNSKTDKKKKSKMRIYLMKYDFHFILKYNIIKLYKEIKIQCFQIYMRDSLDRNNNSQREQDR